MTSCSIERSFSQYLLSAAPRTWEIFFFLASSRPERPVML
jgi:hypothetical protein